MGVVKVSTTGSSIYRTETKCVSWGVPYGQPVTATTNRILECRCEWEGRTCVYYSPTWTIETHTELDGEASPSLFVNLFIYLVQQVTNSFFSFIYFIYMYHGRKLQKYYCFGGGRMVNRVWCSHDHFSLWEKRKSNGTSTTKPFVSFGSLTFLILLLYRMYSSFVCFYFHVWFFFNPNICIVSCNVFSKF